MNANEIDEYNLAMLQMVQALARSQSAVASILEHTSSTATKYQLPIGLIQEQLRSLAGYQSTLIAQLSGVQLKRVKRGIPCHQPWLNTIMIRHKRRGEE